MKIGFHVSISGSLDLSVDRAIEIGCSTFQIFTRNPRSWKARSIKSLEAEAFRRKIKSSGIHPVFSHMPYIPNLASSNEEIYKKSLETLLIEKERCRILGIPFIVTHLGSHTGSGNAKGETQLINAIGTVADEDGPRLLLENGSGSGGHMGSRLSDLLRIIKGVGSPSLGVCFDTCHAYAAGYNVPTNEGLRVTLKEIKNTIGFHRLKLVHLNDSVGELGSGVDHHEHIGMGRIGEEGFRIILASHLSKRPLIMETPIDGRRTDKENMRKVLELQDVARTI